MSAWVYVDTEYNIEGDQEITDEYLGCFKDTKYRALPFKAPNFSQDEICVANANDYCRGICFDHGYTHYGLQNSYECFCGFNNYDMYGELPESSCFKKCTD